MTGILDHTTTTIRRVRLRTSAPDSLRARLRVESILKASSFRGSTLPAPAILCVRRLSDPRPGAIRIDRPGAMPPAQWESALQQSLAEISRRAIRVAIQPADDNAAAVWFADRSELMAVMAADWLDLSIRRKWWWDALFRASDWTAAVVREWQEHSAHVPAALETMAERGAAARFVASLPRAAVVQLAESVVECHGLVLPALRAAAAVSVLPMLRQAIPVARYQRAAPTPPWRHVLQEDRMPDATTVAAQILLGVSAMLRRAPAVARSEAFRRDWERWVAEVRAREEGADLEAETADWAVADAPSPALDAALEALAIAPPSIDPAVAIDPTGPERGAFHEETTAALSHPLVEEPAPSVPVRVQVETTVREEAILASAETTTPEDTARVETSAPVQEPPLKEVEIERAKPPAATIPALPSVSALEVVRTAYGGIFFLANAALALGLYGDFTAPLASTIDLPFWDFLALAGREFMGEEFESDPAWVFFANLAGRAAEDAPGGHFEPPPEWRVPEEWLAVFPDHGPYFRQVVDGRALTLHPAGFCVSDAPAHDARRTTERWSKHLFGYLRARFALALRTDDPQAAVELLIRHPARIVQTATHVEVYFSLDTHPVAIRVAGLDRNPGWIPAAGRYIGFHFE